MFRNPILLKIWGVGISALGLWHIASWRQNLDPNKDGFTLAVGIFCLLIGVLVVTLNLSKSEKRKDN
jgi:hypothetical protein